MLGHVGLAKLQVLSLLSRETLCALLSSWLRMLINSIITYVHCTVSICTNICECVGLSSCRPSASVCPLPPPNALPPPNEVAVTEP